MSDFDNLKLCIECGDRYTTAESGLCHVCAHQHMIDDAETESDYHDQDFIDSLDDDPQFDEDGTWY